MDVHDDVWTAYCQEPGEEILPDSLDPLKGLAVDGPSTLSETSVGRCRLECLPDEPLCVRNRQAVNRVALHHGRQSGDRSAARSEEKAGNPGGQYPQNAEAQSEELRYRYRCYS